MQNKKKTMNDNYKVNQNEVTNSSNNEEAYDAPHNHTDDSTLGGHVEMEGIVLDSVRGICHVELDSGQIVIAHLSGKMRMNKILILPEDKVRVQLSPYDLSKGRIVRRIK